MYKKLINNTILFAIGNLFSKCMIFILLPIHTRVLSPEEYGKIDLIITTLSILLVITTLNYIEGFVRFGLESKKEAKIYLNNSLPIVLMSITFVIISTISFSMFVKIDVYIKVSLLIFIIQIIHQLCKQYTRVVGKIKLYVLGDIINSLTFLITNIYFLLHLKLGIFGFLISMMLGPLTEIIMILLFSQLIKDIDFYSIKKSRIKEIIIFSIYLLPNAMIWWVINVSDRYLITFYSGLAATGIYVIANKIPMIINMLYTFFYSAFQITAVEIFKNDDGEKKLTKLISNTFIIVTLFCISIILMSSKMVDILFGKSMNDIKVYLPWLILTSLYSCMSSLIGMIYLLQKENKFSMISSILCAFINIILNFILIPLYSINGAVAATLISFLCMFFYRTIDINKRFSMKLPLKTFLIYSLVLILIILLLNVFKESPLYYSFLLFIILLISLFSYKKYKIKKS